MSNSKEVNKQLLSKFIEHVKQRKGDDDEAAIYGLIGECGEVVDIIKKHKFHGHELDKNKLSEEIGDALFYWVWENDFHSDHLEWIDSFLKEHFRIELDGVFDTFDEIALKIIFGSINEYELIFNDILVQNIKKLEKRYPKGFDKERSINRES